MQNEIDLAQSRAGCDPARPAGCRSCAGSKWVRWIGLLAVVGVYLYASRSGGPAAPAAVPWVESYDQAMRQAAEKQQPILLAFEATWCGPCRWMDNEVFSKPAAAKALEGWVPTHIDVDKQSRIADQYRVSAVPTFIALSPDGKELARADGALDLNDFARFLASAEAARATKASPG